MKRYHRKTEHDIFHIGFSIGDDSVCNISNGFVWHFISEIDKREEIMQQQW